MTKAGRLREDNKQSYIERLETLRDSVPPEADEITRQSWVNYLNQRIEDEKKAGGRAA